MTENIINVIQIILIVAAFIISFRNALKYHSRVWSVASFFYAVFAMGDIFYMLIQLFYHRNYVFYIPDIGWYSSYLFLDLILIMVTSENEKKYRYKILLLVPVFTFSMLVFFVAVSGDVPANLAAMLTMTFLLLRSSRGLIYTGRVESGNDRDHTEYDGHERRQLYATVFAFCITEYCLWTISCFWMGDTMRNPYYWFDILLTLMMLMLLPAIRKAVNR